MGRRRIRGFKARLGWECCISRGGTRFNSGGIQARGVRGGSHSVASRDSLGGGGASEMRTAKSSEFEKGKL